MKIEKITNNEFILKFSDLDEFINLQKEISEIEYNQRIALTCHFMPKKTVKILEHSIDFEMIFDLLTESDISPEFKKLTELRDLMADLYQNPIVVKYFE